MKTFPFFAAAVVAASALISSAFAQTPSTPAPALVATPAPTITAPASLQPNQMVYAPRLPTPQELTAVAAARGVSIDRIEQTPSQVTVAYKLANGQTNVVGYVLLPAANAATITTVAPTQPTVIYQTPPRVVYYDSAYYDPWYLYPPIALSFGFGSYYGGHGYYHGGHYGQFHGGGHWHR
jgi:flagellar basal body rod protein FlgC